MNDVFQLIKEKIIQQEMSSVDAALIAFVLVFILGNRRGRTETFQTGRQLGFKEDKKMKEGLKQGRRDINEMKIERCW
eukprot:scaffold2849_cov203-Alexandrium_tamarense.AAC.27